MALVSVITPTYNRADKLPRAIESVLSQTHTGIEHIIVDDASTDNTEEIVKNYDDPRVRYIKHESNERQAAARNTGIEVGNGKYIAFIDSDDEWLPTKLEKQIELIESCNKSFAGVYCDGKTIRNSRIKDFFASVFPYEIRNEGQEELIRDILTMQGNISAGSSLLVRTEVARSIGGFDESLPRHEDLDFTLRILYEGKIGYVDEELFVVYESADPSSEMMAKSKAEYLSKHSKTIERLENQGYPVRRYHNFHLARCFFSDGKIQSGLEHIASASASNPRQYLRLGVAIIEGLKLTITRNL
jgi:glycosyltransferase involved in cell wall biosynthesis